MTSLQADDEPRLQASLEAFASRPVPLELDTQLQRMMQSCVDCGHADLPLPGRGHTLARWRALARIGGTDLALAKLFEGHTDAKAILAELHARAVDKPGTWGVWAAEPPSARVRIVGADGDRVMLEGVKAWCSGALQIDHALLTAWDQDDRPQLVAVSLDQPALSMHSLDWQARGMAGTASVNVALQGAIGQPVGASGEYLQRRGFWHGGAGIAACWYGAAQALAEYLRKACGGRSPDAHAEAHLGAVDAALCGAGAALRECAAWIDAHPQADAELIVRRTRAQVESAVEQVQRHVGRALGATPFCRDPHFARLSADLPVFIRQSHAERDLAELGRQQARPSAVSWNL